MLVNCSAVVHFTFFSLLLCPSEVSNFGRKKKVNLSQANGPASFFYLHFSRALLSFNSRLLWKSRDKKRNEMDQSESAVKSESLRGRWLLAQKRPCKGENERAGRSGRRGGVTFFQVLWPFLILYVNTVSSQWASESEEAVGDRGSSATCTTWPTLTSACFPAWKMRSRRLVSLLRLFTSRHLTERRVYTA